jgi:hypothetical protein
MPKIDVVLNIIQAAMTYSNNPAVNKLYALLAVNRNELQGICENQPGNGDLMADEAVMFAIDQALKPRWMEQAGL